MAGPTIDFYNTLGVSSADSQRMLDTLRYYDPNAQYLSNMGAGEGAGTVDTGNVTYDVTKLPTSKYGNYGSFDSYDANKDLLVNPNLFYEDPVYGKITPNTNIKDSHTWLETVGPLAVAAITAGLGGPMTFGQSVASKIPNIVGNLATGGGINIGSLAGMAGSAFGLPPAVVSGLKLAGGFLPNLFADSPKGNNTMYNPEQQSPYDLSPYPYSLSTSNSPTSPTPAGDSGGGLDLSQIWNTITGGSGSMPDMADSLWLPALATAYKQYRDSGKYMDTAREAASISNPAGDRSLYVNKLKDLYTNPNAILSDPSYQWRLNQGMANVDRRLGAAGYLGSGKQAVDLTNYAQNFASTEWEKEVNRLANLGGFQFDPANAGKMLMTGQQQQIQSQNAALGSMFFPLLAKAVAKQQSQRPGMGDNSEITKIIKQAVSSGMGLTDVVKGLVSAGMSQQDIMRIIGDFSISPIDLTNAGMPFGPDQDVADSVGNILGDPSNAFLPDGGTPSLDDIVGGIDWDAISNDWDL